MTIMRRWIATGGRRWRALNRREDGSGLAYVMVIGVVLLVFLIALVDVLTKEMRFLVGAARRGQLVHGADAGVDRALYSLQKAGNWDGIVNGTVTGYAQDVVYTDIPGMQYTIRVRDGNWTPYTPAMGPENQWTPAGDKKLDRTVTVYVTYTTTGERKKIQALLSQTQLNSALFSAGPVEVNGSCDIHWGPVVSYATTANSIVDPANWTDHPVYMSKGGIQFKGSQAKALGLDCEDPIVGKCVDEYAGENLSDKPNLEDRLNQWRLEAMTMPGYYFGPLPSNSPVVDMCGMNSKATFPSGMENGKAVFFDSCDGANFNPATDTICSGTYVDGSSARGCDMKFTDGCGKGNLIVMGDLTLAGQGSCPSTLMTAPSNCIGKLEAVAANCSNKMSVKLSWDGFLYVANALKATGTQQIYGSLAAYNTAGVNGNFSIYYKTANDGLGQLGKSIVVRLWTERKPLLTDAFP